MKKSLLSIGLMLMYFLPICAQKSVYIPLEWRNRTDTLIWAESDPDNKYTWSRSRSKETDNVIILWDKGYGSTNPTNAPSAYRVDIEDLSAKVESFYQLECDLLGFVDPETSNLKKYKVMVLLNHDTGWICYGGGYDYQVPALWLSPSTCKPVGSAVAHEVGHSFHYMCYCEDSNHGATSGIQTGFHGAVGNGAAIWETTANWQALQSYPDEIMTESYHHLLFDKSHNYAFTHEWHRYQAYMFLYYLCEYYNDIKTVANVWNTHETTIKDFNQVLMDCKGLSVSELYKLHFDFAMHAVTWDLEACKKYRDSYIGNFKYNCSMIADSTYQVAFSSCPQSTGFNVIPLQVPAAGTEVTTDFTAMRNFQKLADADPVEYFDGDKYTSISRVRYVNNSDATSRGFRLGYVVLLKDGTRQYFAQDSIYCTGNTNKTESVSFTVPDNVDRMWMVVSPTPSKYIQHKWDEDVTNDDQWPYYVHFNGTDIGEGATVYVAPEIDGRAISDITLTYDVYMPARTNNDYTAVGVTVSGEALAKVETAFQLTGSEIASKMVNYSSSGPNAGQIMFYAAKSDGTLIKSQSTANGYGHWFNASGGVTNWGSGSYIYSEWDSSSFTFNIGEYPGNCKNGSNYTVCQALRYKQDSSTEAKALFVFNVHIDNSQTGYSLSSIDYDADTAVTIHDVDNDDTSEFVNVYSLSGQKLKSNITINEATNGLARGIYIVGNKKISVR